jgi:benzoyl-CoA reductase/2-hydroxyglutaryl-CoA dehydratase subunit BcrC/BadD/HgdB
LEEKRALMEKLDVNFDLHEQLMESLSKLHERYFLKQNNRPRTMVQFDRSFHESHGGRVREVLRHREDGGKSIGTFCIYVPEEVALAANVLIIPLCGGSAWAIPFADKALPRDICPLIRSTFGMAIGAVCPYKKLKDFVVGETTCDAKKKVWDFFGFKVLELPQKKRPQDFQLWLDEVMEFKRMMEELSGNTIMPESLHEAICLMNRKRRILQKINAFRKLRSPPISGLDALLVSQVALSQDVCAFIDDAEALAGELQERVTGGVSAYNGDGRRVLFAGSPAPMGYAKVHHIAETSGLHIVADESCTGSRYFNALVDEGPRDIEGMLRSIAERYFTIDCSCFTPNTERLENIMGLVEDYRIGGVVHHILQYCHTYNVEARTIERALRKKGIPSIIIETDYSEEDAGQIRTRLEAFAELLEKVK